MGRATRRWVLPGLAAAVVLALGLTACSQVSALAPVSGDGITTLRMAADDVLLENGVAVLVAPKCKADGSAYACQGSTVDGSPISVTSAAGKPRRMTVTVGGTVLYDGEVDPVVQKAAEAKP